MANTGDANLFEFLVCERNQGFANNLIFWTSSAWFIRNLAVSPTHEAIAIPP